MRPFHDEFNKSQSDYKVKCVTQADYDETYQKVQAGIAGGTAPDIALLDVNSSRTLNQKKVLEDISTYTKDDSDFNKDDYLDVFLNQGVDDENKTFAIPAYGTTRISQIQQLYGHLFQHSLIQQSTLQRRYG